MLKSIIIFSVTIVSMIVSVLIQPSLEKKGIKIPLYPIVATIGALLALLLKCVDLSIIRDSFFSTSSVNPLKILILFISMSLLSIYLDEVGFFKYMASLTLSKAKGSQTKLFIALYVIVSILTIFTSNDIIILSFTPFILYFCKSAKINPIPYLSLEFVAANTWSMALIIGNPTNIYLATFASIDFLTYLKVMILPTLGTGIVSFITLYLLFRKKLKEKIDCEDVEISKIEDKTSLIIGLILLGTTTILLALSSYINLEMWIACLSALTLLIIINIVISILKKKKPSLLLSSLKRGPYELIPFVLSMFVLILSLKENGVTDLICQAFGDQLSILKYGVSSFLSCNIINNIPMSVAFSEVIAPLEGVVKLKALYSTIIGSNLGAFLTPIGALAGIMFTSLVSEGGVKYNYIDFLKTGIVVSVPSLLTALGILYLIFI